MNEHFDDAARRAWRDEPSAIGAADIGKIVDGRLREQRSRVRRFLASAAIIVPAWAAAFVLMPDLRPLATVGLAGAALLGWQALRRDTLAAEPGIPCAAFEVATLARERRFHRSMSGWGIVPLVAMQLAIMATLVMNERFEKTAWFVASLTAFIITAASVLMFVFRRSRRLAGELDREIAILQRGVEA